MCVCVRGGWQPPWGGHLGWLSAAIYISKPRRRILPPHSSCLFWGVTFWQSEKLFAAASKPPVTCISASPGPCVTGMPSPPCHSQAPPPSLCPLSICWVGPWLFPEAVFKVWRWCLYLGPCTLFLEPERPVYFPWDSSAPLWCTLVPALDSAPAPFEFLIPSGLTVGTG